MSSTEQQLTSALDTYFSKLNKTKQKNRRVFFSSTKQTIYLYPFTDIAGGQDGVQWTTVVRHLCTVLWLCRHTQLWKMQMGDWPDFSWAIAILCLYFSSVILKHRQCYPYMERFSSEPRLLARPFNVLSSCIHGKHLLISPGVQREFSFWFLCFTHCETC